MPSPFRLSVQTKVLIPVLACLVLLPAITVWIVDGSTGQQAHDESVGTLATADAVFRQLVENQLQSQLDRFRNALTQRGYRTISENLATVRTAAAEETIREFFSESLESYGDATAVMLFSYDEAGRPVGALRGVRFELDEFARAAASLSGAALKGEPRTGCLSVGGRALYVVALPMTTLSGRQVGALTVGVLLGDAAVQELKKLTHTEILILANGQVGASTLPAAEAASLRLGALPGGPAANPPGAEEVLVQGEHFLAQSGAYDTGAGSRGFRYVLLSSFEASLRALGETRRTLVAVSALGIALCAILVWFFVRRFIHPLRELRDTAEAVGRGDFSRKIGRVANDECGDLAEAFDRMTGNIQASRGELERAVETLKATQTQLIQSEKLSAVGQFVAGVAHELNNPLTAVIGFSDLLVQTSTDEKIRLHLERIAKNAHRCHKIVQNLLGFARQDPPERTRVAVNSAIDEVLDIMTYEFRTGNIEIVRDFQADLPLIQADRHQLQQVFVNILSNGRQAIQAFRPDGRIVIRTWAAGARVRIEFADNGPGVSPDHLSRLFDPFFTTKPIGKGTGLGLSLCYGIVREHGGTIAAQSEPGQGAAFVIELPVAPEAAQLRDTDSVAASPGRAPGAGRSVLVVDDEEEIRALAEELLRHDGYAVETVASGEKAIDALARRRFDVIVSDWKMPGMNGIQFYEHLLTTDRPAAARVCFMTGDVVNDAFQEFLRRHGRPCLPKPFSIKDFQDAVADLLERATL
jgi:two-component system, NtrC family, sensor kinase